MRKMNFSNKYLMIFLLLTLIIILFSILIVFSEKQEERWDFLKSIEKCGDLPKEILGMGIGPKMGDYTSPFISEKIWSPDCKKVVYSLISSTEDKTEEGIWFLTISRSENESIIEKRELIPFPQIPGKNKSPIFMGWSSNEVIILKLGTREFQYNFSLKELKEIE